MENKTEYSSSVMLANEIIEFVRIKVDNDEKWKTLSMIDVVEILHRATGGMIGILQNILKKLDKEAEEAVKETSKTSEETTSDN